MKKGDCTTCGSDNTQCAPFGLEAKFFPKPYRTNVKLYFNTGESFPYCSTDEKKFYFNLQHFNTVYSFAGSHYAVKVDLAKPSDAKSTVNGNFGLSVSGVNGVLPYVEL